MPANLRMLLIRSVINRTAKKHPIVFKIIENSLGLPVSVLCYESNYLEEGFILKDTFDLGYEIGYEFFLAILQNLERSLKIDISREDLLSNFFINASGEVIYGRSYRKLPIAGSNEESIEYDYSYKEEIAKHSVYINNYKAYYTAKDLINVELDLNQSYLISNKLVAAYKKAEVDRNNSMDKKTQVQLLEFQFPVRQQYKALFLIKSFQSLNAKNYSIL